MTEVFSYFKQQAASAIDQFKHSSNLLIKKAIYIFFKNITKENGSIYKSTRERVDSRN